MKFRSLLALHKHIGLDLDDTLTNTMEDGLKKLHEQGYLLTIKNIESIHSFDWTEKWDWDITEKQFKEFWGQHSLKELTPYHEAKIWIQNFYHTWKTISIVTARNEHDHKIDAESWLGNHFPEIDKENIHFANHLSGESTPKSQICKKYGITLMIDDAFHNAVDLIENDITCILLEKPWNRNCLLTHPLLHRAKDWNEIISKIH